MKRRKGSWQYHGPYNPILQPISTPLLPPTCYSYVEAITADDKGPPDGPCLTCGKPWSEHENEPKKSYSDWWKK